MKFDTLLKMLIVIISLMLSLFSFDNVYAKSVYIEGYIPHPKSPETKVEKVYLFINQGRIVKKSTEQFDVASETQKILESETGPLLLSSGFIDLHGHLKYHAVSLWADAQGQFDNRFHWRGKSSYKTNVSSLLNNEALGTSSNQNSLLCQTYQYAEIKALAGGVTSVQGVGNDMGCTAGILARNVEIETDYEDAKDIRVSTEMVTPNITKLFQELVFPKMITEKKSFDDVYNATTVEERSIMAQSTQDFFLSLRTSYLEYFQRMLPIGDLRTLIAHLSEGKSTDQYNRLEYKLVKALGMAQKGLVIIHGVGLDAADLEHAAQNEMSIVWSPFSNLLLYGETLDVRQALAHNINLTLGADWSPSGSKNLLDEVKIAKTHLLKQNRRTVSDRLLYNMMTINPAKALKLSHKIGQLEENYLADIVAFRLKSQKINPYTQIIDSEVSDIQFVMVGGELKIAQKAIGENENNADYLITQTGNVDCESEKTIMTVNTPIKMTDLEKNLLTIFPKLDSVTGCNDQNYKDVRMNVFKETWGQISSPLSTTEKKNFDVLENQLSIINQNQN